MRADRYASHANSVHPQNKDKKIFYLSFSQDTIYGIIIIAISRQRELEDFKWIYTSTLNDVSFLNGESFLLDLLEHDIHVYIEVNRQIQKIHLKILKILEQKRISTI